MLTYLLLVLLAGLIFYGGAGVNWVTYCCENCFKIGIQFAVSENCCATHMHDTESEPDTSAVKADATIDGWHNCGIERVEFEWTVFENERLLIIQPFVTDLISFLPYLSSLIDYGLGDAILLNEGAPPSVLLPRAYLTLLTTLLI